MAPSARAHTVMPSCDPASITVSSDDDRSAARAERLVAAASSRRWRFAAISANSIATKNALSAMRATVAIATTQAPLIGPPPS